MWPIDPAEQEAFARALVLGRSEHRRVDLKSNLPLEPKIHIAELVRDISAIANTDDDWGYIIVGAQRGRVIGNVDALADANLERTSEKLSQCAHNYLDPVPSFRLVPFHDRDPGVGPWGAIVIEPSSEQPYMFVRAFGDDKGKVAVRSGDWYVRRGDTTDLALPRDWARVLERRVRRALQPLELEVRSLRERMAALEASSPDAIVARALTELLPRLASAGSGGNDDEMGIDWVLRNVGGTPFEVVDAVATWGFTQRAQCLLVGTGRTDLAQHAAALHEIRVEVSDPIVGAGAATHLFNAVKCTKDDRAVLAHLRELYEKTPEARGKRAPPNQEIRVKLAVQHRISKAHAETEAYYAW